MSHSWVGLELIVSAFLIGLSAAWVWLRDVPLAAALSPSAGATALGVAAGLTLALTLPLVTAPWARRVLLLRGLHRVWRSLESAIGTLGWREALVLAACSGVSEELFFRGVLQQEVGVLGASAVFGMMHPLGRAYVVWAATVGAGLGMLFIASGSLLAPMAAHGTYNLVALTYLRHCANRRRSLG